LARKGFFKFRAEQTGSRATLLMVVRRTPCDESDNEGPKPIYR